MDTLLDATLDRPALQVVEAELNYLRAAEPRPVSYTFEPPPGVPWTIGELEPHRVAIHDARPLSDRGELSLDVQGFERLTRPSALADFGDDEAIRREYYPESAEILKAATGASEVVVFDHTLRDSAYGSRATASLREPVRRVHNDQTFTSGPRRVLDHSPPDRAQARLRGRHAIVNLWRPLATVEQLPLALCDTRSIERGDLVPSDLVYRDKVGETYSFLYNPAHRWYYFPRLRPEEALLLKIYDSLEDGTARYTAHTAFEDPHSAADAPPRRSIELRALLFWAD